MALGNGRGAGVGAAALGELDAACALPRVGLAPVAHGVQGLARLQIHSGCAERDVDRGRRLVLDRDLDAGALAARGRGDRGLAGLHARHLAGPVDRGHGRVGGLPRHGPVGRVARADRRGQLGGSALPHGQLARGHAGARDRHGSHRHVRRAGHGRERGRGAVPAHRAAVVVQTRLTGTRELLRAAVVENHLRVRGQAVRDLVLVSGLVAVVRRRHLDAGPGRVVDRAGAVARVHVRVHLAPAGGLGRVDGVLLHRGGRDLAGHRDGD